MALRSIIVLVFATVILFCTPALAKKEKIHLQWAICDRDYRTVLFKLGLEGQDPYKGNNVTYYDTAPPKYEKRGIGFRSKVMKGKPISIIKVRLDEKPEYPPAGAECLWDQYGHRVSYTCGMKSTLSNSSTSLWSADQMAFAEQFGPVEWDALKSYGPFFDPKWKFRLGKGKATFDVVLAEVDGEPLHLMEIEAKVKLSARKKTYRKITKWLLKQGVELCAVQQGKTSRLFEALGWTLSDEAGEEQNVLNVWEL